MARLVTILMRHGRIRTATEPLSDEEVQLIAAELGVEIENDW
jgi:hypothetical protein